MGSEINENVTLYEGSGLVFGSPERKNNMKTFYDWYIIDTKIERIMGQGRVSARNREEAALLIDGSKYQDKIKTGEIEIKILELFSFGKE